MFDFRKRACYNAFEKKRRRRDMLDEKKLNILTESAKYDVSCSSSGSPRKNSGGLGNAAPAGICHSFTPDGRCISLLKILLSNECAFDCSYCVNRRSNDLPRTTATPQEICELTMNFYKRNFIEGLFLSSTIYRNPEYTMELLLETVRKLRNEYKFNGYIHLKGIPGASYELIRQAASLADRMSFNIELPSEKSLKALAPQKSKKAIFLPMNTLSIEKRETKKEKRGSLFLPAGQTTQMIVGASPEKDGKIIRLSQALYDRFSLKRVYYSSYVPVNAKTSLLPTAPVGLLKEHRLYQADWLMRFYGFNAEEILPEDEDLRQDVDPKHAWALRNLDKFPVEINDASIEELLRVPGIGVRSVYKIINARRYSKLSIESLKKMRVVLKRARDFITIGGKFFGGNTPFLPIMQTDENNTFSQLSMFSDQSIYQSALYGEF